MNSRRKKRKYFCELGRAIYGPRWQSAAARDLAVDQKQLNRWANDVYEIHVNYIVDLKRIGMAKAAAINELLMVNHMEL